MTVDEAIAIAETVLDGEGLNDVQELIFRQCWEGRCSYEEISQLSQYNDEYIKALAAKLWKQLSEAFDEKVKKNNLRSVFKRYLRRHQVTLHRTQVIGVNLSGANLTGARLSFANLSESDSSADLHGAILADYNTVSDEIIKAEDAHNQGILSSTKERIYHWNDLRFHSQEQVKIAEALDRPTPSFSLTPKPASPHPQADKTKNPISSSSTKANGVFSKYPIPTQKKMKRAIASLHPTESASSTIATLTDAAKNPIALSKSF
jgi:Pentapeptide repeats (8 copies)